MKVVGNEGIAQHPVLSFSDEVDSAIREFFKSAQLSNK